MTSVGVVILPNFLMCIALEFGAKHIVMQETYGNQGQFR